MDIQQNDYLQIFLDGDSIVLKKSQLSCSLCGNTDNLKDFRDKKVCRECLAELAKIK